MSRPERRWRHCIRKAYPEGSDFLAPCSHAEDFATSLLLLAEESWELGKEALRKRDFPSARFAVDVGYAALRVAEKKLRQQKGRR